MKSLDNTAVVHPFGPICDEHSRILILGSFPSVKSRAVNFYYGHPQNRFWRVLADVLACRVPQTIEEKTNMLLAHHIALWDVLHSCEIVGSSDASIKNAAPNDIGALLDTHKISAVFSNGATSYRLYRNYIYPQNQTPHFLLPSTSPANAAYSVDALCSKWSVIKAYL